jgi:hypothetical protein
MSEAKRKISVARLGAEARHTTTVTLTLEDEVGNVETVEARIVYRGLSLKTGAELEAQLENLDERASLIKALSGVVISLPDFAGDDGEPVAPTEDFWDTLDTVVLHAINTAIREHRNPPTNRSGF